MNREAELDKLLMDMVYLIQGYDHSEDCTELDRSAVNRTKAEILALIDRLVIEGQNSKLDEAVDMARRADDFVGDVKVVRVTHLLSLKALLSQSSQQGVDRADSQDTEEVSSE